MKQIHEINNPGGADAFQTAVDDFSAAIEMHKTSEGSPAPLVRPNVEEAYNLGVGNWEYISTPIPEPQPEPVPLTYKQQREAEYPLIGDMIDAVAKALEGDSTEFTTLQAIRTSIKLKYPKPV